MKHLEDLFPGLRGAAWRVTGPAGEKYNCICLGGATDAASIDPEKIRAHVRFLASDLLEGRGPGTRGGQLAAEYIATQLALAGAKPAGEDGTYFQKVPLMAVHTEVDKTSFTSLIPRL